MRQPGTNALRQLAMAQQRAGAARAKSAALAALGLAFGQKLADVRRAYRGAALRSAIAALMQERHAAERALVAQQAGEAAAERLTLAQRFRTQKTPADRDGAARAMPHRPHPHARGTAGPRLQP